MGALSCLSMDRAEPVMWISRPNGHGMGVGAWVIGASYRTVDGQGARRAHFNAKELGGHGMDTAVV